MRTSISTSTVVAIIPVLALIFAPSAQAQTDATRPPVGGVPRRLAEALTKRVGSNDFNHDGHGDILWNNAANGETQIWFMRGSSRIGRANVGPSLSIMPPWRIAGSRDFNEDGQTDLLMHNSTSGEVQIWALNDHTRVSRDALLGKDGNVSFIRLPWRIVGTYGGNQPGTVDIVWHNGSTGETQIWYVSRHRVTTRATVLGENGSPAFVGKPWSIVAIADMNRDRNPDILLHNSSTGETQIWHMSGRKVIGRATVAGENGSSIFFGLPWTIAGTNDFNEDGASDILWHNGVTGESQIWFMDGLTVVRRATVDADLDGGGSSVGAPWSIMNH